MLAWLFDFFKGKNITYILSSMCLCFRVDVELAIMQLVLISVFVYSTASVRCGVHNKIHYTTILFGSWEFFSNTAVFSLKLNWFMQSTFMIYVKFLYFKQAFVMIFFFKSTKCLYRNKVSNGHIKCKSIS